MPTLDRRTFLQLGGAGAGAMLAPWSHAATTAPAPDVAPLARRLEGVWRRRQHRLHLSGGLKAAGLTGLKVMREGHFGYMLWQAASGAFAGVIAGSYVTVSDRHYRENYRVFNFGNDHEPHSVGFAAKFTADGYDHVAEGLYGSVESFDRVAGRPVAAELQGVWSVETPDRTEVAGLLLVQGDYAFEVLSRDEFHLVSASIGRLEERSGQLVHIPLVRSAGDLGAPESWQVRGGAEGRLELVRGGQPRSQRLTRRPEHRE